MNDTERLLKHLQNNRLITYMNNTKWEKLIFEINVKEDYSPHVRIKYLYDLEPPEGFSPVWWDEVKQFGYKYIEWMEINPIVKEYVGQLVPDKITSYLTFIEDTLRRCNQSHEVHDGIFKIYGYRRIR